MATQTKALATIDTPYLALREPETLHELLEENIGEGETFSVASLPRLTVPAGGGTFWVIESGGKSEAKNSIEGIVVHKQKKRVYWEKRLGDGEIQPPDCASTDAKTGYARRDEDGNPLMWQEQGGCMECAKCPFAQWGSGRNGGQACALRMDLFVLLPDKLLPVVVSLAPVSVAVAEKTFSSLLVDGIALSRAVLSFSLEKVTTGANSYSKVKIEVARVLLNDEAGLAKTYKDGIVPFLKAA
jgi:hypothetical protein